MPLITLPDHSATTGPPPTTALPAPCPSPRAVCLQPGRPPVQHRPPAGAWGQPWESPETPETTQGIAGTQGVMKGAPRLQERVVPAADLRLLLGQQAACFDEHTALIVLTLHDRWVGAVVDAASASRLERHGPQHRPRP